jgi:SAM-dependent methyltransferase
VEAWLAATLARFAPPLTFTELRKGVRALSSLYVERRGEGGAGSRVFDGAAKRAAFAVYFAPLHLLTVERALAEIGSAWLQGVERVLDLGCGTGAAGAAAARAVPGRPPRVLASDRSPFALAEARHTYAAFGLEARLRRDALPRALAAARRGDLIVLGWVVNECAPAAREATRLALAHAVAGGARLLLLEPLAGAAAPWWPEWSAAFAALGVRAAEIHAEALLPEFLSRMDRASGLRHDVLGARLLFGPV